jgi:hypothetical protein
MSKDYILGELHKGKWIINTTRLVFEFLRAFLKESDATILGKFKIHAIAIHDEKEVYDPANRYLYYLLDISASAKKDIELLKKMSIYVKDYPYDVLPYGTLHVLVIKCPFVSAFDSYLKKRCKNESPVSRNYGNIYNGRQLTSISERQNIIPNNIGKFALDVILGIQPLLEWDWDKEVLKNTN